MRGLLVAGYRCIDPHLELRNQESPCSITLVPSELAVGSCEAAFGSYFVAFASDEAAFGSQVTTFASC